MVSKQQRRGGRSWWLPAMVVAICCMAVATGALAADISQGYHADTTLTPGTIVSTADSSQDKVVPADLTTTSQLLGVVVGVGQTTLAVSQPGEQQVSTTGTTSVFVSDLDGAISSGDPITTSPIEGVGMKALASGKIIGIAQASSKAAGSTAVTVHLKNGQTRTTHISMLPVSIQVGYYSSPVATSPVPDFLQVFANNIAGKQVSAVRVLVSATIVLVAMIISSILLFSAVRSTMVSIGRNPLAQTSIYRGLWQVVGAAIVIMVVALSGAYAVLSR